MYAYSHFRLRSSCRRLAFVSFFKDLDSSLTRREIVVPVLSGCLAGQACPLHTRQVETVLHQFSMSPKSLLLDQLKSCMYINLLEFLDRANRVLVSLFTGIAQHIFRHAPSSMAGNVQVITQGSLIALLNL